MSPRTRVQLDQMKAESRNAIIRAALELFAKNGYSATTTDEIAEKAGISKGLIYSYFETKQDILLGIVDEGINRIVAGMESAVRGATPSERLRQLITGWVDKIKTDPLFVRLLLQLHLKDDFRILLKERGIEYVELYLAQLREVFADLGSNDPDLDCYLLGAMMDGLSLNYCAAPELIPIDKISERIIETFINRRDPQ